MQILFDENFPADFAGLITGHEALHVHKLGWAGVKNGELLRRAATVCQVFVTLDRNLVFQQNIKALPFGIVIVHAVSNRMADLTPLVGAILAAALRAGPGVAVTLGN